MKNILFVAMLLCFACNPARQIEKAEQRVITSAASFNKIGKLWGTLNPCANDTFYRTHQDTLLTVDTAKLVIHDSIHHIDTIRITVERKIFIRDTAVIVDRRQQKLDADSIAKLNRQFVAANQNIVDLTSAASKIDKERKQWLIFFIVATVLFFLSNGLWIFIKLKSL